MSPQQEPGQEQVGPRIGNARFYTYAGQTFSFGRWVDGVKAGHTFVTSGPMLDFKVNDRLPGSSMDVKPGAMLHISATAYGHPSQIPLKRLQIIGHGKVLAEVTDDAPGQTPGRLSVDLELPAEHGIWLAARADADVTQIAHTTPVYVTVNGDGFQNRANLASRIKIVESYLQEIRDFIGLSTTGDDLKAWRETPPSAFWDDREARHSTPLPSSYSGTTSRLERRIAEAEAKLEELRGRP